MNNTIAAIATATGTGGIGIIRMSGDNCFEVLKKIFKPIDKNFDWNNIKGYTIKYGYIINSKNKERIEEVLVSFFKAPKSYTTENMCEINCHGGTIIEKKILNECLLNGADLAEAGEFTKRAFLNGRIDLSQAESVIDIINAKSDKELNELYNKYLKELQTSKYSNIRDSIIKGQRNWLKGRNKFTTEDKLSIYYTALIHAYKQVFGDPGYVKAAADTSEEDPMIVPFSFYLTNNYIIDTNKEKFHIFLNQDEICSNLSKRKPITYEYYLKNGKPSKVGYESRSSIDTINLLFYKNGAYALDEDLFIY